eukprot:m.75482 g.75482  ORF g.75482 m.75482 type:complete len:1672 (-) comp16172_c1_seq12:83-5098(-)
MDSEFGGFDDVASDRMSPRRSSAEMSTSKRSPSPKRRATVWGDVVPQEDLLNGATSTIEKIPGWNHAGIDTKRRVPDSARVSSDDDLAQMDSLTDDTLNKCLEQRYKNNKIYTYVGDILIAINPFKDLGLYTADHSILYTALANKVEFAPHLFAIADSCYTSLMRSAQSQVVVISGESGAGKTESAKLFIRQVLDISSSDLCGNGSKKMTLANAARGSGIHNELGASHPVEQKILKINPILEGFGNAKTMMNDNSSRFGKLIELEFCRQGTVQGARLSHYLLEKSRVTGYCDGGESNYHVFHQLLAGVDDAMAEQYALVRGSHFRLCGKVPAQAPTQSQRQTPGLALDWLEVLESFGIVGLLDSEQEDCIAALATILHTGNIVFEDNAATDGCAVVPGANCDVAASLISVAPEAFVEVLTHSSMNTRDGVILKPRKVVDADATRDALVKAIYDRMFTWMVRRLDRLLNHDGGSSDAAESSSANGRGNRGSFSVGVLDIFGFERFKVNGFGQMCINFANERLQSYFNKHIFKDEAKAYQEEGLDLLAVHFTDNEELLTMFSRKPLGLLAILNEESRFPKATPKSLVEKLAANLEQNSGVLKVHGTHAFEIKHYAGGVVYVPDDFLEANKDPLPEEIIRLLSRSKSILLKHLFSDDYTQANHHDTGGTIRRASKRKSRLARLSTKVFGSGAASGGAGSVRGAHGGGGGRGGGNKKKNAKPNTVAQAFKDSLDQLLRKMEVSQPHFVRCIKPNSSKTAGLFEAEFVHRQLNYTGMLQTTKIRREGYTHRLPFGEFFATYRGYAFPFVDDVNRYAKTNEWRDNLAAQFRVNPSDRQRDLVRTILQTCEQRHARAVAHRRGAKLLDHWQIGKTRVFLKYWHLDILNAMMKPYELAAVVLQRYLRMAVDRLRFLRLRDTSRRQQAMAADFVADTFSQILENWAVQKGLVDEDSRRNKTDTIKAGVALREQAGRGNIPGTKQGRRLYEKDKKAVWKWFMKTERPCRAHTDESGRVHPWFHGQLHRDDAERLLRNTAAGTFLVRVSDRAENYALSIWHPPRTRHYRIFKESSERYSVYGETRNHDFGSLSEVIEYHGQVPVSVAAGDTCDTPLPRSANGRNIHVGLDQELELTADGIDPVARDGPGVKKASSAAAPPPGKMRARSNSLASLMFIDEDEDEGAPIEPSRYLQPQTIAGYGPSYMRGDIDREEACLIIGNMAMPDGAFLIRDKIKTNRRVVYALSYCYKKRVYHHQLLFDGREWLIENVPSGHRGTLESLVTKLQKRDISALHCALLETSKLRFQAKSAGHAPRPPSVSRIPGGAKARNRGAPKPPSISKIPKGGLWIDNPPPLPPNNARTPQGKGAKRHAKNPKGKSANGTATPAASVYEQPTVHNFGFDLDDDDNQPRAPPAAVELSTAFVREASYVYQETKDLRAPDGEPESNYREPTALVGDGGGADALLEDIPRRPSLSPPTLPAKVGDNSEFAADDFDADSSVSFRDNAPSVGASLNARNRMSGALSPETAPKDYSLSYNSHFDGASSKAQSKHAKKRRGSRQGAPSDFWEAKVFGKLSNEALLVKMCKKGQTEKAAKLLAEADVNVNAIRRHGSGRTPLHYCAARGHDAVVEVLLRHGADPSARDASGQTIIAVAAEHGHYNIVQKLKRASFAPGAHQLLSELK